VAPKSRIIERPLLDNGSVATNPTSDTSVTCIGYFFYILLGLEELQLRGYVHVLTESLMFPMLTIDNIASLKNYRK
jgi:hypothetical protein